MKRYKYLLWVISASKGHIKGSHTPISSPRRNSELEGKGEEKGKGALGGCLGNGRLAANSHHGADEPSAEAEHIPSGLKSLLFSRVKNEIKIT